MFLFLTPTVIFAEFFALSTVVPYINKMFHLALGKDKRVSNVSSSGACTAHVIKKRTNCLKIEICVGLTSTVVYHCQRMQDIEVYTSMRQILLHYFVLEFLTLNATFSD